MLSMYVMQAGLGIDVLLPADDGCVRVCGADRDKRENMAEGDVSMIKHFQGVAIQSQAAANTAAA